jgi:hypothetical protein
MGRIQCDRADLPATGHYDQKEDEYLPRGAIGKAFEARASTGLAHFEAGETTPEEIASRIGTPRLTRCEIESCCGIQP